MTDEEKEANPTYHTTGGYLKVYNYKEAFQASYNRATREEQLRIKELPNFSSEVFKEISGIDIDDTLPLESDEIEVNGVKYVRKDT